MTANSSLCTPLVFGTPQANALAKEVNAEEKKPKIAVAFYSYQWHQHAKERRLPWDGKGFFFFVVDSTQKLEVTARDIVVDALFQSLDARTPLEKRKDIIVYEESISIKGIALVPNWETLEGLNLCSPCWIAAPVQFPIPLPVQE